NQTEMELGKLAKARGQSQRVRSFGDMLMKDHTLADRQVEAFAKRKGVQIPQVTPKDDAEAEQMRRDEDTLERLKTLEGDEFDRSFAQMMAGGHQRTISAVEAGRSQTQDPQFYTLLGRLLPVLREHYGIAAKMVRVSTKPEA